MLRACISIARHPVDVAHRRTQRVAAELALQYMHPQTVIELMRRIRMTERMDTPPLCVCPRLVLRG